MGTDIAAVMKRNRAKKGIIKFIVIVCLCIWFFLSVLPFIWALVVSLKYTKDAFVMPPKWIFTPTFEYYRALWEEGNFAYYLKNTLIVTGSCVVTAMVIGAPCGYILSRYSKGSGFTLLCVSLFFRALPTMVLILPYYVIAQRLGLYDTKILLIVAIVAGNQPFTIWIQRSFFLTVPQSLDEAAMVDGCTRFKSFLHVILPVSLTGAITSAIFTCMFSYNEYMIPAALSATRSMTLPVMIAQFGGEDLRYWSISAAGNISIAIPLIIFVIALQKYLVGGMSAGAVKE